MQTTLRSQDLACPSCVSAIEKTLQNSAGVDEATVHFNTGRIEIAYDAEETSEEDLVQIVERAGYEVEVSAF